MSYILAGIIVYMYICVKKKKSRLTEIFTHFNPLFSHFLF